MHIVGWIAGISLVLFEAMGVVLAIQGARMLLREKRLQYALAYARV